MVVLVVGFFAVCVAYVALCDRIVGPDVVAAAPDPEPAPASDPEPVPASEATS